MAGAHTHTSPSAGDFITAGYMVLRGVIEIDDIVGCRDECERLLSSELPDPRNLRTLYRDLPDGTPAVERIDPIIDISPCLRALARDPRLLGPARALLGDEPLLFKDKLILKPPGMSGYLCHQDQAWWQLCPARDVVSVLVALDDATDDNGCLSVYPGCHDRLRTPEGELRNLTDAERGALPYPPVTVPLAAGDAVAFSSLLPHESDANRSRESRRALCVTYSAGKLGSLYDKQRNQYLAMKRAELDDAERRHVFVR